MLAEAVGVHPVEAPEPCHLVEIAVEGVESPFDMGDVTQPVDGRPRSEWQVPWDEHFLDSSGTRVLDSSRPDSPPTGRDLRVAFFFHHLDLDRPLNTPWGLLRLPRPTMRPARLEFMRYEAPC